jgi:hypothetical protein
MFLVRWKDYPEDETTWEPLKELNCDYLIYQFMKNKK